jgi:outer membrane protein OmpA-like peptidoglycan-associated protein
MKSRPYVILLSVVCVMGSGPHAGAAPDPTPHYVPGDYSGQKFAVYSGRDTRNSHYIPSGYMGDSDLTMSGSYVPTHDAKGTALRVNYTPRGSKNWSGLYWQQPANNWGEQPGKAGYDLHAASRLVFWMRGEAGGEKIHEVRVGGIVGRYPDSDVVTKGPIKLSTEWRRYEIDLEGKDLRHIIGGFGFFVNKYDNAGPITFYIDDIVYEFPRDSTLPPLQSAGAEAGPAGGETTPAVAVSTPAVVESTPAVTPSSPTLALPPVSPSKEIQIKSEEQGLRVSFSSQFLFAVGQTVLRPESTHLLNQLIKLLNAYPKNDVLIEGYTDSTGAAEYNLTLSGLRAGRVRDYLIKEGGFDAKRFRVVGYGATHPIADNHTRDGRSQNRRVEVIILKTAENK